MLEELVVEGYALIDKVSVQFTSGLNVLSGETGAGKSILVGAVGLILGERSDASVIRAGQESALVSGVIAVQGHPEVAAWLDEHGIQPEDGSIIIRRVMRKTGRSQIFVQSTPVTRLDVQELTSLIFDIHGQHQHQSLLKIETHRKLIDRYGAIEDQVLDYHSDFTNLSAKKAELESLVADEKNWQHERDLLIFSLKEIADSNLLEGEEEELKVEIQLLSQHEKVFSLLTDFSTHLSESQQGALASVRNAMQDLKELGSIDPALNALSARLESSFYELEDVTESVRLYQQSVDFSPDRLDQCEERLANIRRLEKKYGSTIPEVLTFAQEGEKKLNKIGNREQEQESLRKEIGDLEKSVWSKAQSISGLRGEAAKKLEKQIQDVLRSLGMPKVVFKIQMGIKESASGRPAVGPWGIDTPEFILSPNEGEPLKPLRSIVSGGEMSRVMLAIKSVLAESDYIRSLIFDEIDAGIGGEVAVSVGTHLSSLANHKQVLCITHLATIAVCADTHIKVEKTVKGDRTVTRVNRLNKSQRVSEVARMLAGDAEGETSLTHAEEMLKKTGRL